MFDCLQGRQFPTARERERVANVLRAAGASDPVHVIFRMLGHIVIDDVTDSCDVEAARRDVGRYHHFILAALESLQRFDALTLCPIGMQYRDSMFPVLEHMRDAIGVLFRPAKNQDTVKIRSLQKRHEQIELLFAGDWINCVCHSFRRRTAHTDFHQRWIAQYPCS